MGCSVERDASAAFVLLHNFIGHRQAGAGSEASIVDEKPRRYSLSDKRSSALRVDLGGGICSGESFQDIGLAHAVASDEYGSRAAYIEIDKEVLQVTIIWQVELVDAHIRRPPASAEPKSGRSRMRCPVTAVASAL